MLHELDSECCPAAPGDASASELAALAISSAKALGVQTALQGSDIRSSARLATLFAAKLLTRHNSNQELDAFCNYLNNLLASDQPSSKYLPVTRRDVFSKLSDGVLLSRVVSTIINTLDPSAYFEIPVDMSEQLSSKQRTRNVNAVLEEARVMGCDVSHVTSDQIMNGR